MCTSRSCFNHAVYLKCATPLARHSKSWRLRTRSACECSVHFLIPINTDHLSILVLNESYPEYSAWITPKFHRVSTLYVCHITLPIYTYEDIQCARIAWVSGEICWSRCCSQYEFYLTAARRYSKYQCKLYVLHASNRMHQSSDYEYRRPPASNKS